MIAAINLVPLESFDAYLDTRNLHCQKNECDDNIVILNSALLPCSPPLFVHAYLQYSQVLQYKCNVVLRILLGYIYKEGTESNSQYKKH